MNREDRDLAEQRHRKYDGLVNAIASTKSLLEQLESQEQWSWQVHTTAELEAL